MPVRIVVLISITSLLIPNLVADLAHAEITSTSLTISASSVPGPLSISVPGTIVFPTVNAPSMVTTASSISMATMGTVLVTDARCDAPNTAWTASAIATALTPTAGPTIAAYGTSDATVTISVPANVISGEQYGVIWPQPIPQLMPSALSLSAALAFECTIRLAQILRPHLAPQQL